MKETLNVAERFQSRQVKGGHRIALNSLKADGYGLGWIVEHSNLVPEDCPIAKGRLSAEPFVITRYRDRKNQHFYSRCTGASVRRKRLEKFKLKSEVVPHPTCSRCEIKR